MVSQNIENDVDSMKILWMYIYCGCIFTVQFFCVRRLVLLSCYIFVRDALYHFYSCKIYWMNLFTYCTSCLHVLPIAPVAFKLAVGNFKKKNGWNKSPVQIPESTHFFHRPALICVEDTIVCGTIPGDHFLSWDPRLRPNLGIICGTRIIRGSGSNSTMRLMWARWSKLRESKVNICRLITP